MSQTSSIVRDGVTPRPTRSSCTFIRGSPSGLRTSSRATPRTPRTRPKTASSRRIARSAASARGRRFGPWLLRIVGNEARNRGRSANRRSALELRLTTSEPSGDAAPSPEANLVAEERRRELLAALALLRDDERRVLECRFFLDLSEEETAAALGIRRGTVKSRQSRALQRLREEVEHG